MRKRHLVLLIFGSLASLSARADEAPPIVKFGAFVDAYYAYDFNRPASGDRAAIDSSTVPPALYSTQPARHNEFNVNLAYLEAKLDHERARGRFALQMGTSVQANYSAEPSRGFISGDAVSRHVQEAVVGYRIAEGLWVDGGIYFSHIGLESFVSRDNWTYTRSLIADNSPYYQTGVKLGYQVTPSLSAQLHLVNGWQNISESNPQKAVGTQVAWELTRELSLTHNTFIGFEQGARIFNDLVAKLRLGERLQLAAAFDLGFQKPVSATTYLSWYGLAAIARYQAFSKVAIAARFERYADPDAVIVASPAAGGFNATGASLGVDAQLEPWLLWRTEARTILAQAPVFESHDGLADRDSFVVSSLALSY